MQKKQEEINKDFVRRIEELEKAVFAGGTVAKRATSGKTMSLPELLKKHTLTNGQEKIATIVGYLEKVKEKAAIANADIRQGWKDGKFDGSFANVLITRAEKDGYIADYDNNGKYTLTQSGEKFWEKLTASH